jgi:hypothetical protein
MGVRTAVSRFFGRASVLLLIREHLQREKKAVDARFYTYKAWNLAVLRMNTYMNLVGSGYCHTRISINQSNISLPKKLVFNVLLKWRQYQNKEKYSAIMARGRKTSGIDSCERTSKRSRCIGDGEPSLSDVPGSLFGPRRHRHAAGEIGVMLAGGRPAIGRENANQHLGLSVL